MENDAHLQTGIHEDTGQLMLSAIDSLPADLARLFSDNVVAPAARSIPFLSALILHTIPERRQRLVQATTSVSLQIAAEPYNPGSQAR